MKPILDSRIDRRRVLQAGGGSLLALAWPAVPAQHLHPAPAASAPARKPRPALGMGVALAPDGARWAVMLDATGALVLQRHAAARDGVWSPARRLAIGDDRLSADGENHPKIAFGPDGRVVIAYTQPLAKPFTGRIRLLRSTDGGASFSAPVTVHRDTQEITHRFESIAFDGAGALHTLWIDKRDLEAAKAAGRAYAGAAVYRNVSLDGGASFGPDLKLADHSCECCRIALARAADGRLAAMWRHVWPTQLRDHAFAWLPAGDAAAPPPVRASLDGWVVEGCPHHGPGLAAADDGGWHAVWFGQRDGLAAVRYGRLGPDGRPRGAARTLPDEAAEHASVACSGRHVVIVWRSQGGEGMRWRAWLSDDDGASFRLRELGHTGGACDHPRLAVDGERVHALWRTADEGVRDVAL